MDPDLSMNVVVEIFFRKCDCEGNKLDALGVCGGSCLSDADKDGICDIVDDCIGKYDSCGICNGPGPIYDCGCNEIPEGDCDCEGNKLDSCGVCGGDNNCKMLMKGWNLISGLHDAKSRFFVENNVQILDIYYFTENGYQKNDSNELDKLTGYWIYAQNSGRIIFRKSE